ncbi:universal stress protein A [Mesorhizobium sp. L-8-10]|uniref:universal stress protein n=1 Tax=Mesorhizobium sp. L-8-10 TaxID=2744523 RepID=UPI001927D607|nr:universal stress protein [Mesorhizobium sp. L-8-10]BCH33309.1 universal stress protein A [Mesorhizobium sp. L-8-10]
MKLKALLPLVTHPDPNSDAVAAHAVAVARQFGADLHVLVVNVDIPPVSNALSDLLLDLPNKIRQAEEQSRARGAHLLDRVEHQASAAGVPLSTEEVSAGPAFLYEKAATSARYFDLDLVGWEKGNPTSRTLAEAVIFGAGRPTILLPEHCDIGTLDRIAIAWDGSRVAARAVADAKPLLARCETVSVVTVVDEKPLAELDAGERLADGLRKRGLQAEATRIEAGDAPVGAILQEQAIQLGAGLLVMGGYGHSRVRDFILGGATEAVLDDLRLPILLSH